ncbi:MAG: lysophospholipid acyltransferase family protein [Nitrospirota bacterium]|nr:lysophospholipid acyltransferase family protein [Nitrospirota bacterium]MDX2420401.1 lysophospholipid acyltransferase family protein [Nitrospirota bacterium]
MSRVIYWILWFFFRLLGRLLFRLRTDGEQFFPKNGGVIVAANHASYFDIPLLGCAIRRRVVFLGRANLFPNRLLSWVLQGLGWIPLKTHRLDRQAFGVALEHLKSGTPVVIFPEGTRTEDGNFQPGRPGIGDLVEESQCQVIPAFISGTFKVLPIKAKWPRLFPVSVSFGESIGFSKNDATNKKQLYEQIGRTVMEHIAKVGGLASPYRDGS